MFRLSMAALVAGSLLMSGMAQAAGLLKDGTFRCVIGNAHLGNIKIENGRYQGPAYDDQYGESYPLDVTDGNTINWGGPLGGISDAGKVVATVLKDAGGNTVGFDITIQNARGNFQTISCYPV